MRRLGLIAAFAALFSLGIAQAQSPVLPGPGLTVASGGASPTWTNQTSGANVTTCGFATTCAITGLAITSGFNVFAPSINNQSATTSTISALTLSGGCSGTLTQAQTNTVPSGGYGVALFYGTVVGGASCTATITASAAGSLANVGIALGLLSNLSSTTPGTGCQLQYPGASNPYPCSGSITVPAGGFGICAIGYNNVTTMTSTNTTIDSQDNVGTGVTSTSIGISHTSVTETPQFSGANFVQAGIACAPWS